MRPKRLAICLFAVAAASAVSARAAFIVEADNAAPAGKANGNFSSVPAGTGFSLSSTPSTALGLSGNQSAFGNPANATGPDQYTFTYTPGTHADNTVFAAATVLGNSQATDGDGLGAGAPTYVTTPQLATGLTGGGSGYYNVYFTIPASTNVAANGSQIVTSHDSGTTALNAVVMNNGATGPEVVAGGAFDGGANNLWLKIASSVPLTAGNAYTVVVTANQAPPGFTSQRAHGVMWEYVGPIIPEPATCSLAGMGLAILVAASRRRA